MTTAVSAFDQISNLASSARSARGEGSGKGVFALLLAPAVLIVAAIVYSLVAGGHSDGVLGTWAVLWFTAIGAFALAAGSLLDSAFATVDDVLASQSEA